MKDRKYQKITMDILPIVTPEQLQSPKPPPVPKLTELQQFMEHFDNVVADDLNSYQENRNHKFKPLQVTYCGETISLPRHDRLYDDFIDDDFIEFLNQQIDNE